MYKMRGQKVHVKAPHGCTRDDLEYSHQCERVEKLFPRSFSPVSLTHDSSGHNSSKAFHLNSKAPIHPRSSTCFNSSCWNLQERQYKYQSQQHSNSLLALRMEVNAADTPIDLIETNIVKALKTRAGNCLHAMIRD